MNVLYILMRTDLPSMNPGKAMAQASHASNAFVYSAAAKEFTNYMNGEVQAWLGETSQGFGTVLVLAVTGKELKEAVEEADRLGFPADTVVDPTYPYRVNGEIAQLIDEANAHTYEGNKEYTLYRAEHTCGYIFGPKDEPMLQQVVGKFKLHQ